jgi:hypothetical protein
MPTHSAAGGAVVVPVTLSELEEANETAAAAVTLGVTASVLVESNPTAAS